MSRILHCPPGQHDMKHSIRLRVLYCRRCVWRVRIPEIRGGSFPTSVAAAASGSQVATGYYTGNDANDRDITGVGFNPEYVIISGINSGQSNQNGWFKGQSVPTTDLAGCYSSPGAKANVIESLITDGFTIGSDAEANKNGDTFEWIAFKP